MGYQGDIIVNLTIMGLIVHGEIGFVGPCRVQAEGEDVVEKVKVLTQS